MTKLAREIFEPEHEMFRESFRTFLARHVLPHYAEWEISGAVDRGVWRLAGTGGFIGLGISEEFGGNGEADWRYNAVIHEETARHTILGLALSIQNDVALPYLGRLGTDEQRHRWLPGIVSGETITAIAMTEPAAGSDLGSISTRARRSVDADGEHFVLTGSKTFISNGQLADLVVVAARTGPHRHRGISMLVVERDMPGFRRGRNLDKIGMHAQDTSELFFDDVRVPVDNLLGFENDGFRAMMLNLPQERLAMAVGAVAGAEQILTGTIEYTRKRTAFGQPIGSFQHNRFVLAELATEVEIAQVFVDRCIGEHVAGTLTADVAAMAKWWTTELQNKVVDRCLQLHGGYGYMNEQQVARAWRDTRAQTIAGGSTEIMKEIIGRSYSL